MNRMFKYLKQALELRRQARELFLAEKRLAKSEVDYLMLEKLAQDTDREIIVETNGTKITFKPKRNSTGYVSFDERYKQYHS